MKFFLKNDDDIEFLDAYRNYSMDYQTQKLDTKEANN